MGLTLFSGRHPRKFALKKDDDSLAGKPKIQIFSPLQKPNFPDIRVDCALPKVLLVKSPKKI